MGASRELTPRSRRLTRRDPTTHRSHLVDNGAANEKGRKRRAVMTPIGRLSIAVAGDFLSHGSESGL
jgi:hypothetical protein